LPPTTSGLETEWDYSGRKGGRDGQKNKIGKANGKKGKRGKSKKEEQKMRVPRAHMGPSAASLSSVLTLKPWSDVQDRQTLI